MWTTSRCTTTYASESRPGSTSTPTASPTPLNDVDAPFDYDVEHDVRGYQMSRELQCVLDRSFRIDCKFHTEQGRKLAREQ
jgi:hypothetical protein